MSLQMAIEEHAEVDRVVETFFDNTKGDSITFTEFSDWAEEHSDIFACLDAVSLRYTNNL